jgi:hypothetical protein
VVAKDALSQQSNSSGACDRDVRVLICALYSVLSVKSSQFAIRHACAQRPAFNFPGDTGAVAVILALDVIAFNERSIKTEEALRRMKVTACS